jgi:hypothetical protein
MPLIRLLETYQVHAAAKCHSPERVVVQQNTLKAPPAKKVMQASSVINTMLVRGLMSLPCHKEPWRILIP